MVGSTGTGAFDGETETLSTFTVQLSAAAHSRPTVLAPAFRSTSAVTVAQSSQLLVAGRVSVLTSQPFTTNRWFAGPARPELRRSWSSAA